MKRREESALGRAAVPAFGLPHDIYERTHPTVAVRLRFGEFVHALSKARIDFFNVAHKRQVDVDKVSHHSLHGAKLLFVPGKLLVMLVYGLFHAWPASPE